ncbi:MAG: hypothetical protein ACW9W3_07335 [Candidatus Nitrosopumilus sp. bin_68KS]
MVIICGFEKRDTIATYALVQEGIDFQVLESEMKVWISHIQSGT